MSKYHEISAVHDNDLEKMLVALGILKELKEGRVLCSFCGKTMTPANIQCFLPRGNEIVLCCDDPECFKKALQDLKGVKTDV
jgi:hypothetical protein